MKEGCRKVSVRIVQHEENGHYCWLLRWKGTGAKERRQPLEAEKVKETNLPLHLDFSPVRPIWIFDFQNFRVFIVLSHQICDSYFSDLLY